VGSLLVRTHDERVIALRSGEVMLLRH
jgi:hypothetical protein